MFGTVIVTGAAGGLGFAISERVLERPEPYNCLFTVRSKAAANAKPLLNLIASSSGDKKVSTPELDLGRLESLKAFAADVNAKVASGALPPIKALILNAAVFHQDGKSLKFTPKDKDGKAIEMQFAVNYLANFVLTLLLLRSIDKEHGRIVYISSWTHDPTLKKNERYHPEKLQWDVEELAYAKQPTVPGDEAQDGMRRYGMSKLCQVTYMNALRKRLDATPGLDKICLIGVDPGAMVHPGLVKNSTAIERMLVTPFMAYTRLAIRLWPNGMFRTVQKSAGDVVRAAFEQNEPDLGKYPKNAYCNGGEPAESAAEAKVEGRQKDLWKASLKYAKIDEKETVLGGKLLA